MTDRDALTDSLLTHSLTHSLTPHTHTHTHTHTLTHSPFPHSLVCEQKASLSAQYEYESKRDFQGALDRLRLQLKEAVEEAAKLTAEEDALVGTDPPLTPL